MVMVRRWELAAVALNFKESSEPASQLRSIHNQRRPQGHPLRATSHLPPILPRKCPGADTFFHRVSAFSKMPRRCCVHNREIPSALASPEEKVMEFKSKWLHTHCKNICLSNELEHTCVCAQGSRFFIVRYNETVAVKTKFLHLPVYSMKAFRSMSCAFRSNWILLYPCPMGKCIC